jgi:hypothetical protein
MGEHAESGVRSGFQPCPSCGRIRRLATPEVCQSCKRFFATICYDPTIVERMRAFLEAFRWAEMYRPRDDENAALKEEVQHLRGQLRRQLAMN